MLSMMSIQIGSNLELDDLLQVRLPDNAAVGGTLPSNKQSFLT